MGTIYVYNIPFHANVDLPSMHAVKETLHESSPLQGEGSDQEVEAHAAEAVALKKGHEEAETNEDHHMHVLETCTRRKMLEPTARVKIKLQPSGC